MRGRQRLPPGCPPSGRAVSASADPAAHAAATCSDYSNQADAQRAADTRDADGDGIYCESLPCPCLKPGSGAPPPKKKPALFRGKCKRGRLPDRHCTPGARFPSVTADDVCTPGYSSGVRNVSAKTKRRVFLRYGIRRHKRGQYEVDHLIPLELGGSNSIKNLFPEAAKPKPGFHQKDRLENRLHSGGVRRDDELARRVASDRGELAPGLPPRVRLDRAPDLFSFAGATSLERVLPRPPWGDSPQRPAPKTR